MKFFPDRKVEGTQIVKKKITPADVPENLKEDQERATYNFIVRLLYSVLGYTINDIGRLKEAALKDVEGKAAVKHSEALQNLADAELKFAQAEEKRAAAEIKKAEAGIKKAKADAIKLEAGAEALERFERAISRMRQQGGDVPFDAEQLKQLILQGSQRYPDERTLRDAANEIEEEGKE